MRGTVRSMNVVVIIAFAVMALLFAGIGLAYGQQTCVATTGGGGEQCFTLWAGQNTNAGTVCVKVVGTDLDVIFQTTSPWTIKEAALWVGQSEADIPQTKTGNPIPGQFPWKSGELAYNVTTYKFSRPLINPIINFACPSPSPVTYYMAAHAALQKASDAGTYQTETGWSDGSLITSKGSWATFSTFTLTCICQTPTATPECETAFARVTGLPASSYTCFNDLGFQRWGWTNGPITAPGTYTFDIWAGAAQCDTKKGMLAGTLTVDYNGVVANVTYSMNSGWWMNETHLYVGTTMLPQYKQGKSLVDTVAPGQYPYIHEGLNNATTDIYTVPISAPFYVVAHAVTCHNVP